MRFSQQVAGRVVYLSGPISGIDPEIAQRRFARAEKVCMEEGAAAVFNPLDPRTVAAREGWDYGRHMLADLHRLTASHTPDGDPTFVLVRLPGWSASRGASLETAVAEACGIEAYDLPRGCR